MCADGRETDGTLLHQFEITSRWIPKEPKEA